MRGRWRLRQTQCRETFLHHLLLLPPRMSLILLPKTSCYENSSTVEKHRCLMLLTYSKYQPRIRTQSNPTSNCDPCYFSYTVLLLTLRRIALSCHMPQLDQLKTIQNSLRKQVYFLPRRRRCSPSHKPIRLFNNSSGFSLNS